VAQTLAAARARQRGIAAQKSFHACGTGKTLAALFITEKLAAERTLVLVPSLSLLAQTLREWTANTRLGFDFLPVCSDETVADPDAVVSNTSDLGFPFTTDPGEIARFLRRRSGPRVLFSTYQSSPQIAEAFRQGRVPAFDLVIADEAHRCAGRVSSDFGTILDSEAIRARRRLFSSRPATQMDDGPTSMVGLGFCGAQLVSTSCVCRRCSGLTCPGRAGQCRQ